jgi:predicted TIM-barrel fold metal-dependent hydrolase
MKFIDVHCHIDCHSLKTARREIKQYLREMKSENLEAACVMACGTNPEGDCFQELEILIEALEPYPHLYAIANIDIADYLFTDLLFLEEKIAQGKVKALKLYPGYCPFYPTDGRCHVFYKLAQHYKIPVMVHTGELWSGEQGALRYSHPLFMDEVALQFPHVSFILCHIGNPFFVDAKVVLYKNKNLYADGSGLFYERNHPHSTSLMQELFHVFAYQDDPKILFGTDFSFTPALEHLFFWKDFFKKYPELEPFQRPFFYTSAQELFRLPSS